MGMLHQANARLVAAYIFINLSKPGISVCKNDGKVKLEANYFAILIYLYAHIVTENQST